MEYNTKRERLTFYDYGRSVYKMIQYAKSISNREERNAAARNIIATMAIVNPSVKNDAEYEHKLWDHLMIWSNYELDVDCPYPMERSNVNMRFEPNKLQHKDNHIRFRHYGKLMESLVKKAGDMLEGDERNYMIKLIANLMMKDYHEWNHDSVPLDILSKQLCDMSDGKLSLPPDMEFATLKMDQPMPHLQKKKDKKKKKFTNKKKGKQ
ncbi:MAG: DUF4290 domain-containing protein [Bacteroidales bacterium]|nr:DUF4290 domain-containing protein [Bacteroidales bacterium]